MTNNEQPSIDIIFKRLAGTAIQRSERGRVALLIKEDTTTEILKYKLSTDIDGTKYTEANKKSIEDCFYGVPMEVTVIPVASATETQDDNINKALKYITAQKIDYIGSNVKEYQDKIAQFVKEQEKLKKTYKAVVTQITTASDCKCVIELENAKVTFTGDRGEADALEYIPSLLGIFAGLSLSRSATYLELKNLKEVSIIDDVDTKIKNGKLCLINDEGLVRISTAVNSLTKIDADNPSVFTSIENVEAMHLIQNDLNTAFKAYIGAYKNTADRQNNVLIPSINAYFDDLEDKEILDKTYDNKSLINIEEQRKAWKAEKGDVVDAWTDKKVKNTPFHKSVFLKGDIKLNESIENIKFGIELF
ncbi:phage tail sheath C-terminal domain-containing protein [Clostridium brassicae]|uniref:Phage tail sheath protein n=1 Tax=Clostridium brassicae TaxID=2999072 RepID=A0ABT4D6N9_9CLOT|nr:phage tail sheath C-terminal domain-containing protein [Clostridium brassicae]MCY6957959.1 phage tail sheath protein [Clostridium brassicae]